MAWEDLEKFKKSESGKFQFFKIQDGETKNITIVSQPLFFKKHFMQVSGKLTTRYCSENENCMFCKEGIKATPRMLVLVYNIDENAIQIAEFNIVTAKAMKKIIDTFKLNPDLPSFTLMRNGKTTNPIPLQKEYPQNFVNYLKKVKEETDIIGIYLNLKERQLSQDNSIAQK